MSTSREFCPRCGDPVPEREEPLPGAPRERDDVLCDACYLAEFDLVDAPDRVEVPVCGSCGAVHRGNRWVDVGAVDYTDVAIDVVSESLGVHLKAEDVRWGVEPEQVDETTIRMHCQFSGVIRGTHVEEEVVVPVKISKGQCKRCGRINGGYFASIVQVRADGRTATKEEQQRAVEIAENLVARRSEDGDRDAFVSAVDETEAGTNIKLSTNKLGRAVASQIVEEFGGHVDDHPTLVTEDGDGNEVYRVTFVARLPRFTAGDVFDPEDGDGPVLVESATGNLKGVRLNSGEPYEASETPDGERLGSRDEASETALVTVEDDHAVQVLDPETYESKTVPRPDYLDADAETVDVLKSRAGVHVLPEEE